MIFVSFEIQILRTSASAVRTSENCLQLAPQDELVLRKISRPDTGTLQVVVKNRFTNLAFNYIFEAFILAKDENCNAVQCKDNFSMHMLKSK